MPTPLPLIVMVVALMWFALRMLQSRSPLLQAVGSVVVVALNATAGLFLGLATVSSITQGAHQPLALNSPQVAGGAILGAAIGAWFGAWSVRRLTQR